MTTELALVDECLSFSFIVKCSPPVPHSAQNYIVPESILCYSIHVYTFSAESGKQGSCVHFAYLVWGMKVSAGIN